MRCTEKSGRQMAVFLEHVCGKKCDWQQAGIAFVHAVQHMQRVEDASDCQGDRSPS